VVLLLDQPPQGWDAMHDFRRLPAAEQAEWSPALNKAFRQAIAQQEVVAELREEQPADIAERLPGAEVLQDPETIAPVVRDVLGVMLADQYQWSRKDATAPLRGWSAAVEEAGVLVLQARRVELGEMRRRRHRTVCRGGLPSAQPPRWRR
jgi:hypothetical protein